MYTSCIVVYLVYVLASPEPLALRRARERRLQGVWRWHPLRHPEVYGGADGIGREGHQVESRRSGREDNVVRELREVPCDAAMAGCVWQQPGI